MKNYYYYDLKNFRRALRRNNIQKVFLSVTEFWFYTRKGVISYDALYSDVVEKFSIWLVTYGIELEKLGEFR